MVQPVSSDWSQWDRVVVDNWVREGTESVGSDGAEWLRAPDESHWLHKSVRDQGSHLDMEDWAEVVTTEFARVLGVPCATTRLCVRNGLNGSLSLRIHDPARHTFVEGGLRLLDRPGVQVVRDRRDHPTANHRTVKQGHTLTNIAEALIGVQVPEGFVGPPDLTAFDVFAGYLCLDAVVANRDRHEQNWAVLEPAAGDGPVMLAPSFDHGSAFGYNLTPTQRASMVSSPSDLEKWAKGGTAWRVEHVRPPGPVTLMDVARAALERCSPSAQQHWTGQFCEFDIDSFMSRLPSSNGLSDPAATLIAMLLEVNRRRFRDAVVDL